MEYLKSIGKSLYIGFLDYEKAFDFISRGKLIEHLKEKGAGSKFVRAVASMYEETSYVPKLKNRIGANWSKTWCNSRTSELNVAVQFRGTRYDK